MSFAANQHSEQQKRNKQGVASAPLSASAKVPAHSLDDGWPSCPEVDDADEFCAFFESSAAPTCWGTPRPAATQQPPVQRTHRTHQGRASSLRNDVENDVAERSVDFDEEVDACGSVCHQPLVAGWKAAVMAAAPPGATATPVRSDGEAGPSARFGHTAVMRGGEMIVFGGRTQHYFNDLWVLDMATRAWCAVSPAAGPSATVPAARAGHTAVVDPEGNMVVFGGSVSGERVMADLWKFDFRSREWRMVKPAKNKPSSQKSGPLRPTARRGHTSTLLSAPGTGGGIKSAGVMAVFGGCGTPGTPHDNHIWEYDLTNNCWFRVAEAGSPPGPRMYHVAEYDPTSGALFVFGGRDCDAVDFFDDLHAFDTATGLWRAVAAKGVPPSRRMCSVSFIRNGVFCVCFGGSHVYLHDSYEYDVADNSWRAMCTGLAPLPLLSEERTDDDASSTTSSSTAASPSASEAAAAGAAHPLLGRTRPTSVVHGNTVTLFGGCQSSGFCNDVLQLKLEVPSLRSLCRRWFAMHGVDPPSVDDGASAAQAGRVLRRMPC